MLAVLIQRGRADALDFTTRERWLQHVGGVDRPFGRSRANQRVQLINEDDDVACLYDLLHDDLETLFELASVLGSCDKGTEIEGNDPPIQEIVGHFGADDPLSQPFHDGRLPHARFADEDWVVLSPAAENLQHALDLVTASDNRIQRVLLGQPCQIPPKLIQRRSIALTVSFARGTLPQEGHRQLSRRE